MKSNHLEIITDPAKEIEVLSRHIRDKARPGCRLQILEAGCGREWPLDIADVDYTLTGVDLDQHALDYRRTVRKDLHKAIPGDICTVDLEDAAFDVVYSSFVLEHVNGAERALNNFARWCKPGGLLILRVPDRDSVYGFLTRVTPYSVHVLYKRLIEGRPNAGKAGFGPYPTIHEPSISRAALHSFCKKSGFVLRQEFGLNNRVVRPVFEPLMNLAQLLLHALSLGTLAYHHRSLTMIMEKCAGGRQLTQEPAEGSSEQDSLRT